MGGGGVFLESTRAGQLSPRLSGLASVRLLSVWYHGFRLIVVSLLFFLSAYRMARG